MQATPGLYRINIQYSVPTEVVILARLTCAVIPLGLEEDLSGPLELEGEGLGCAHLKDRQEVEIEVEEVAVLARLQLGGRSR